MDKVNHFDIKRSAHRISRRDSSMSWNPFRHFTWDRTNSQRAETWNGDVEAAGGLNALEHSKSEPISPSSRGILGESLGESSRNALGKETEEPSNRARSGSGHDETATESQQSTAPLVTASGKDGEPNSLRNRKQEGTNSTVDTRTTAEKEKAEAEDKSKEPKQGRWIKHIRPKKPFTVANQLQRTFLSSWINILILAAPAGIAMSHVGVNGIAVFVVNFLAIIPLAAMLSFATEEIALRTGETLGGLLNATFGNAVELIVAILALVHDEIPIVKTSLIGSILSNLLLVLGFCFFFGGANRLEQHFNTTVAQTAASLLALAIGSVIIPTVFDTSTPASDSDVAAISRGVAVILLVVYVAYLVFQLKTHSEVFNEESQKVPAKPWNHGHAPERRLADGLMQSGVGIAHPRMDTSDRENLSRIMMRHPAMNDEDDDGEDEPQLEFIVALAALGISTVIIAFCADAMVTSIGDVTKSGGLKEEFVGLILLPIVGNAAEHVTAVTVAMKDKMDLAIGVAVGSSMQVALFLIPLLVVIGWGLGKQHMDLSFDIFQVAVMFVAVLLVNYLIADGKSHWLEGMLLICLYAIIAVCAFFYPNIEGVNLTG